MNLVIALVLLLFQSEVPLKPKDEFEIKLDYQVKRRPTVEFSGYSTEPIKKNEPATPYVILNIKILKVSLEESRIVIKSNLHDNLLNRKIQEGTIIKLDLGFTDDVKNRVTAYEYSIYFMDSKRTSVQKILIRIDQDGVFHVNDEIRGKF